MCVVLEVAVGVADVADVVVVVIIAVIIIIIIIIIPVVVVDGYAVVILFKGANNMMARGRLYEICFLMPKCGMHGGFSNKN